MPEQIPVISYVKLPHFEMDGNFTSKILESAKNKLSNTSTEEGYILDVVSVENILENKIKNNSVVFKVQLKTLCIKLQKDLVV